MRRAVYFFIFIVGFISCENIEFEYSCDPLINQFIIDNKTELSTINLQKLTSYELLLQKAIFNSWDASKKRIEWINKLEFVLNNTSFNITETDHIRKLISHIDDDYFLNSSSLSKADYNKQFEEDWLNYAKKQLKWSDKYIAFLVFRLYKYENQLDSELSELAELNKAISNSSEAVCECNVSSDWCGSSSNCKSASCTITFGCGALWAHECNGLCN